MSAPPALSVSSLSSASVVIEMGTACAFSSTRCAVVSTDGRRTCVPSSVCWARLLGMVTPPSSAVEAMNREKADLNVMFGPVTVEGKEVSVMARSLRQGAEPDKWPKCRFVAGRAVLPSAGGQGGK